MTSNVKITKLPNSTISRPAATSDIVDDEQKRCLSDIKALETKLHTLQQDLETKNSMLHNAASAGQQLVNENDNLHQKLKDTAKLLKEKDDEIETYKRTNEMLKITATRSGAEADELHKKLIESQSIHQQLQEENALLISMKNTSSAPQHIPHAFDEHTAKDIISTLQHEKCTLEQFLRSEQDKCMKFLQNAEINARELSHQQNENQDLKEEIKKLETENHALTLNTQREIQKYSDTLHQIQCENESLRHNLIEQQKIVNDLRRESMHHTITSPTQPQQQLSRQFSLSDPGEDGLLGDLQASGYFESNIEDDTPQSNDVLVPSPSQQFRRATVDAQEEFFRLTIIAAKIKFNDIPIATSVLWEKVKEANLSFHELADWLNEYLLMERKKIGEAQEENRDSRRLRLTSITDTQVASDTAATSSPSKHFFRKIKDLADSVTTFSSTLRLEVRFGRRVFEVKMKKHDKLETLLQTLPRIIGEDADSMEIFTGNRRLDPNKTLNDLHLNNNGILRMIHQKKVPSYLKRYDRKMRDDSSGIEMDSENTTPSY